jgi:predicted ATPase
VPGAEIFGFDQSPIRKVNYEDTEHYRIYKEFMKNRKKFLS